MNIMGLDKTTSELLDNRESFGVFGIAGGAKTSLLRKLAEYGFTNPAIYGPYNKVVNGHISRFKSELGKQGVTIIVKTYASGFERQIFGGHGYKACSKDCTELETADIIIFDEVFAVDRKLILRAIKNVEDAGIPYILIGDECQSHRDDKYERLKKKDVNVRILEVDESLRGARVDKNDYNSEFTEGGKNNIMFIETLYKIAKMKGEVSYQALAQHALDLGATVDCDLPVDDGKCIIGSTSNEFSEYFIATSGAEYKKEFSGKVEYTQEGELTKKYRDAPVVSQAKKNQLSSFSQQVVATPATHWTHTTCIGCEVPELTEYHWIIYTKAPYDAEGMYTLGSRQITMEHLHLHFIDELPNPTQFKAVKKISDGTNIDCPVYTKVQWCTSTLAELGLPESYKDQEIKVTSKLFKALESKVTKPYMQGTERIYCEGDTVIRVDKLGVPELPENPKDIVYPTFQGDATENLKSKAEQVLAELSVMCPDIMCDPTEVTLVNGAIIPNSILPIMPVKEQEVKVEAEEAFSLLSEAIDLEDVSVAPSSTQYELDFCASYWQQMVLNGHGIACGRVIPYDEDAPISHFKCVVNGTPREITTPVLQAYADAGCEITKITPLCSRTATFQPTQEMIEHIYKRRHLDYTKDEMNIFGTQERLRFKKYSMVYPEHTDDKGNVIPKEVKTVFLDEGEKACLYSFMNDIKQIQALLTFLVSKEQPLQVSYGTDCIITANYPIMPETLPQGFKIMDYSITERTGYSQANRTRIYNKGTEVFQARLDRIQEKRKESKHARTITKEEQDLEYVLKCWGEGVSPEFGKLSAGVRQLNRVAKKITLEAEKVEKENKKNMVADFIENNCSQK